MSCLSSHTARSVRRCSHWNWRLVAMAWALGGLLATSIIAGEMRPATPPARQQYCSLWNDNMSCYLNIDVILSHQLFRVTMSMSGNSFRLYSETLCYLLLCFRIMHLWIRFCLLRIYEESSDWRLPPENLFCPTTRKCTIVKKVYTKRLAARCFEFCIFVYVRHL